MSAVAKNWSFYTFSCCETSGMSLFACMVPCSCICIQCIDAKLTHPESNEHISAFFCTFCLCIGMAYNRAVLRKKLQIEGNYCLDLACHCCCTCCSLVQEWREVMKFKLGNDRISIFEYSSKLNAPNQQ